MSQEPNHIDAAIADLEAWRDRINASIETLKRFRAQGLNVPETAPPASTRTAHGSEISHDAFFQMTIPDAAKKYLSLVKQTKTTPEMAEALISGGLKTAAKNFTDMLRSIVSRDDRFVRVNGEWGLAEWYPAMRRERKPRHANGNDDPDTDSKQNEDSREASVDDVSQAYKGHSVTARTLRLLEDSAQRIFSAKDVSEAIGAELETVRTSLAQLFRNDLIAKPSLGKYQSKKGQSASAA